MINTFLHEIQITGLAKEEPYYIKLKLVFATGEAKQIQFRLDPFTYQHLSKVVLPDFLNQTNGAVCSIPVRTDYYYGKSETEWVIWKIVEDESRFSFACSPEYKKFLNRLRKIENIEAFQAIIPKKIEAPSRLAQPRQRKIPKFIPLSVGLCLILGLITTMTALSRQESKNQVDNQAGEADLLAIQNPLPDLISANDELTVSANTIPITEKATELEEDTDTASDTELETKGTPTDIINSLPEGYVALTFDDGPSKYTEEILAVLEDYDIPATFFFIGQNIKRFPEAVTAVRDKGHGVGLHSFSHRALRDLSQEALEEDIASCLEVIEPYVDDVALFRPPYGMYDDHIKNIVLKHGMSLVLWNRDPKDWDAGSSRQIIKAVLDTPPSGGIYVMHETELTLEALPQIIEEILAEGLEFINLENMPTEQTIYHAADAEQKTAL
ncbi:MAG: polysaccharide deacetylase family protein [Clostridia bacterium]|nr:polysaccharide deacetylase family protein [Clostridia bacterium]